MKNSRMVGSLFVASAWVAAAHGADPSGIWTWTTRFGSGGIKTTLKLESKGGKLTGAYSNQFGDTAISNATLQGDILSFDVVRDLGGRKYVVKYRGKLEGDTIKGTIDAPGHDGGKSVTLDWTAKRGKED